LGLIGFHGPRGWGLLAAIGFVGAVLWAKARPFEVPLWTAWLGDISYSLYLFHPLAFIALTNAAIHSGLTGPVAGALRFVLQPALAVVLAPAVFRCVAAPPSG